MLSGVQKCLLLLPLIGTTAYWYYCLLVLQLIGTTAYWYCYLLVLLLIGTPAPHSMPPPTSYSLLLGRVRSAPATFLVDGSRPRPEANLLLH